MFENSGLTISQLKICYDMFLNPQTSFYSNLYTIQKIEKNDWTYFFAFNSIYHDFRILFYPVTLFKNSEPYAKNLETLLNFACQELNTPSHQIHRIIIPVGEIIISKLLPTTRHMITVLIDFIYFKQSSKPTVHVRIIDSFGFSLPGYNQTTDIINIINRYFRVEKYQREYLAHQSWFDRQSCCYFTLKIIQQSLSNSIFSRQHFAQTIPHPNTWIQTSHNWLTYFNKQEIHEKIFEYAKEIEKSISETIDIYDKIIELD